MRALFAENGKWNGAMASGHVLITGGAGFIGTNLAARLASEGRRVVVYDNLSRPGVEKNAEFLGEEHGDRVEVRVGDVCDRRTLRGCLQGAAAVVHLAAQVAVTSSLADPGADLRANVLGTFSLLEELRSLREQTPLLFTSTNKVYGDLRDVKLEQRGSRYQPVDEVLLANGIDERRPLDFQSPYGCSKGAADQYVLDYCRSYGLATAVFRMSCIYGLHQCGTEDQGWVAHVVRCALEGRPITIFGDGRQVRDVLFADDLVEAFAAALADFRRVKGRAFNIGGGPGSALSLRDLIGVLEARGLEPEVGYGDWRTGDQRWYVSDTAAFRGATGWRPAVSVAEGLDRLIDWLRPAAETARERPVVRETVTRKVAQR